MNRRLIRACVFFTLIAARWTTAVGDSRAEPKQKGSADPLPRVLILGDSISMGYTGPVRERLRGVADLHRPSVNCQDTSNGLARIKTWLGTNQWDVIHFNFGIWDTHIMDAEGKLLSRTRAGDSQTPDGNLRIRHTPAQYATNLIQLVEILKGTGATLVWASTTPIMYRTETRFEAIPTLNRVAADIMRAQGIAINDLYALTLPHAAEWQNKDQVHFNTQGNQHLADEVARWIRQAISDLPAPDTQRKDNQE